MGNWMASVGCEGRILSIEGGLVKKCGAKATLRQAGPRGRGSGRLAGVVAQGIHEQMPVLFHERRARG